MPDTELTKVEVKVLQLIKDSKTPCTRTEISKELSPDAGSLVEPLRKNGLIEPGIGCDSRPDTLFIGSDGIFSITEKGKAELIRYKSKRNEIRKKFIIIFIFGGSLTAILALLWDIFS